MSTSNQKITIKMVICGEVGVGKTCLYTRINNLEYNPEPQTTSNDYQRKTIKKGNKTINIEFWDTAGQEKYYSLNRIFFKDAKIAIIVYDITRRKTFEKLKDFWINEIKSHSKDLSIIGIAANKSDLYGEEEVNEEEARNFAVSVGALFKLCSALNNEGINELVDELVDKFLDSVYNIKKDDLNENTKQNEVQKEFKLNGNYTKKDKKCC